MANYNKKTIHQQSISDYLSKSSQLIQSAQASLSSEPSKAVRLLGDQLNQHIELLNRLYDSRC